jgi:hypothetical protein
VASLLARSSGTRKYEASDVTKVKDHFYVVYDNLYGMAQKQIIIISHCHCHCHGDEWWCHTIGIGRLDINLPFNSYQNWLVHDSGDVTEGDSGYEALVHDSKVRAISLLSLQHNQ